MKRAIRVVAAALVLGMVGVSPSGAAEVRIEHKGLGLLGEAVLAPGKTWKDGAILLLHGTMTHRSMDTTAHLQRALLEQGLSSLSMTLSLGLSDRRGNADCDVAQTHRHQDAPAEIAAWIAYLKAEGATNITMLGFSRGGNQAARLAVDGMDSTVKRMVLLAPMAWDEKRVSDGYENFHRASLRTRLAEADRMVKAGKGKDLMRGIGFQSCPKTDVGAETFLSYYRDDGRMDTPSLVPTIKLPILFVTATLDEMFPDLPQRMKDKQGPNVRMASIDGANHFFRDLLSDEVADAVVKFLEGK